MASAAKGFGGQSMAGPLRRVIVCPPRAAGWDEPGRSEAWRALGYGHAPRAERAGEQHALFLGHLRECGAEILELSGTDTLPMDAVYVRDPSLITDHGAVCLRMGKPLRAAEPDAHRALYAGLGVPLLGEIADPGRAEAGDMVWLDDRTLLVGRGYRTNAAGIAQLGSLLAPHGIRVLAAPLLHGGGPEVCFHLMSILSVPDERVALVDMALAAVETIELLEAMDFRLLPIDPAERETQAANVLSLGNGRVVAIAENVRTNERLAAAGLDVRTFPGGEICQNGSGGPTCLSRPLLRA